MISLKVITESDAVVVSGMEGAGLGCANEPAKKVWSKSNKKMGLLPARAFTICVIFGMRQLTLQTSPVPVILDRA